MWFNFIFYFLNPKNGSRLCFPEMTDLYLLQGKMTWRNVLQKTNVRFEFVTASWFFDTIFVYCIYIYIDFFIFLRCCWPKEENLLVEFDELTSMEYAASCPSIPFQRVLSSQILNCFFLTPWKMPRLPTKTFFFYEPILERLRDSSRDSNGTVNSHQWGTSLGSKLNHSEIDSQRNSKEDS